MKQLKFLFPMPLLATLLFATLSTVHADVFMKQKRHIDGFTMMGQTQPAKDSFVDTWFATDKIRSDQDKSSTIVRLDKNVLYIIDHDKKTYLERPFNLNNPINEKMPGNLGINIIVTPANENKKINNWTCKKYLQKMDIMGMSMTSEVWATEDIRMDYEVYSKFLSASFRQNPAMRADMEKLIKEMKKIKGVQVLTVTSNVVMGQTMKTVQELVDFKEGTAPVGIFDLPAGYKKVKIGGTGYYQGRQQ